MKECTDSPSCPHATAAAKEAVKEMFAIVGVNVNVPKEVEAFREELRFGRKVKRVSDRTVMAAIAAIATILVTVILNKLGLLS